MNHQKPLEKSQRLKKGGIKNEVNREVFLEDQQSTNRILWVFMTSKTVPLTNKQGKRDIRITKVQQTISSNLGQWMGHKRTAWSGVNTNGYEKQPADIGCIRSFFCRRVAWFYTGWIGSYGMCWIVVFFCVFNNLICSPILLSKSEDSSILSFLSSPDSFIFISNRLVFSSGTMILDNNSEVISPSTFPLEATTILIHGANG